MLSLKKITNFECLGIKKFENIELKKKELIIPIFKTNYIALKQKFQIHGHDRANLYIKYDIKGI